MGSKMLLAPDQGSTVEDQTMLTWPCGSTPAAGIAVIGRPTVRSAVGLQLLLLATWRVASANTSVVLYRAQIAVTLPCGSAVTHG